MNKSCVEVIMESDNSIDKPWFPYSSNDFNSVVEWWHATLVYPNGLYFQINDNDGSGVDDVC